jgi:DNA-binding NtrC family response regulator
MSLNSGTALKIIEDAKANASDYIRFPFPNDHFNQIIQNSAIHSRKDAKKSISYNQPIKSS